MADCARVLVVDDEPRIVEMLALNLTISGYQVLKAYNGEEALSQAKGNCPDVVVADLVLPDMNGVELIQKFHDEEPLLPVIIITAYGSIPNAVAAMKAGAYDYVTKPLSPEDLLMRVAKALETCQLREIVKDLREQLKSRQDSFNIVGVSPVILEVREQIRRVALSDVTVLVQGESGTGKELVSKAIHSASRRRNRAFITVDCSAMPSELLENELFGHVRGAYTSAYEDRKGLFESGNGGTIFLDEIGDMGLTVQAKLLRVLQEGTFRRIGSNQVQQVNVRIVAATNKDLPQQVANGQFRQDLYYRLGVVVINLPPLRDRKEDIPLLATFFLRRYATEQSRVEGFSNEALQSMLKYPWPGNVRELANKINQAVIMARGRRIQVTDLFPEMRNEPFSGGIKPFSEAKRELINRFEREYLINLLRLHNGDVRAAAQQAGKERANFYSLLRRHRIDPQPFRETHQ